MKSGATRTCAPFSSHLEVHPPRAALPSDAEVPPSVPLQEKLQGTFPPHKRAHCAVEVLRMAAEKAGTAEAKFVMSIGCVRPPPQIRSCSSQARGRRPRKQRSERPSTDSAV